MSDLEDHNAPASPVHITIVIPVMNERESVAAVISEIGAALSDVEYEILFVDDGSTDGTFAILKNLAAANPRVRALRFRKNAGKASAYDAGFRHARGEFVATLDGDGQDDPKDVRRMMELLGDESDLVVGWRTNRKTSFVYTLLSPLSNALFRMTGGVRVHDINCPVRVMRKDVADALDLRADLHRYVPLLAAARGFRVTESAVENRPRQTGESKYSPWKYPTSAVSLIGVLLYLRYGQRPMALFGGLGVLTLGFGILIDLWVVVRFVVFKTDIDDDIPTLILGVLLILIGTQFLSLGVLAELILRQTGQVGPGRTYDVVEDIGS